MLNSIYDSRLQVASTGSLPNGIENKCLRRAP
jgi:hypothetical protein